MSPSEYLKTLGLKVWSVGDELRVSPKEKVNPAVESFIKAHKLEIMAELKSSVLYRNPYSQGTKEARQESLLQIIDAICWRGPTKVHGVCENTESIPDHQTLEEIRQAVMNGEAKLTDFQLAFDEWAYKVALSGAC